MTNQPLHRSDREIIADLRASVDALEATVGLQFGVYGLTRIKLSLSIARDLEALGGEPVTSSAIRASSKDIEGIMRMLKDVEFEVCSNMRDIEAELNSIRTAVEDLT